MSTKLDEIYAAVLPEMEANNIPDTTENRHDFLIGLRDSWLEDDSKSLEKSLYLVTLSLEISRLRIKMYTRK